MKEALIEIVNGLKTQIEQIESNLGIAMLIGDPFLLVRDGVLVDGKTQIYGEWTPLDSKDGKKVKGFIHEDLVPSHLCGTIQMSRESADRNVKALIASGEQGNFYALDFRLFLKNRAATMKNEVAKFQTMLDDLRALEIRQAELI